MTDVEPVIQLLTDKLSRRQAKIDEIIVYLADRDPELAREVEEEVLDYA